MSLDSRLSLALHALLHLAQRTDPVTSEELARSSSAHPVVVRRTLAGLRDAGLVRSGKGHGGGWSLARDPAAITVRDVHRALGSPSLLSVGLRQRGPDCLVEQAVNGALEGVLREAEALVERRFTDVTLDHLAADVRARHLARPTHTPPESP